LTAVALACPLHTLWRIIKDKRMGCVSADEASWFADRQRELAERIEVLAKVEPTSERH
jgi:hypothetical protein